ncbi:MAG: hypothetical protein M3R72_10655, partial [Bacteroidota bacterium]|nr:hypothetical protein [Bacteroidota bacterium]
TVKVKKDFHLYPGIDVEVEHITLKSAGFLVQASVNISPRKLSLQSGVAPSSFTWQGFIKAVDNFGYHYLTWVENLSSGDTHFHKYQEQLTMAFYPALAANSTELTFSSEPMVIETSTVSQEGHLLQLPAITGNNLLCYVSL